MSGAIHTIPIPVIGGISMMLFGVIAASGLRMLIEANVDYSKTRNLLLSAIVFVVGISGVSLKLGQTRLKGMVLGTVVGIVLGLLFFVLDKAGLTEEQTTPGTRRVAVAVVPAGLIVTCLAIMRTCPRWYRFMK